MAVGTQRSRVAGSVKAVAGDGGWGGRLAIVLCYEPWDIIQKKLVPMRSWPFFFLCGLRSPFLVRVPGPRPASVPVLDLLAE